MNKFVIKEIKQDEVVFSGLKLEFTLPTRLLPKGLKVGETIVLTLSSVEDNQKKEERTAKEILNEILKVD